MRSPPCPSRGALTRTSIASCTPASLSCVFAPRHTLGGAHDCARAGRPGGCSRSQGHTALQDRTCRPRPLKKVTVQLADAGLPEEGLAGMHRGRQSLRGRKGRGVTEHRARPAGTLNSPVPLTETRGHGTAHGHFLFATRVECLSLRLSPCVCLCRSFS